MLVFENVLEFAKCTKDYANVHIFFDENCDKQTLSFFENLLFGKTVCKSYFGAAVASVSAADRIEYIGEDLVLAIGGVQMQNLAKFYASMYEVDCAFVPICEVVEYSFSKYAFVKDKFFCFFECEKPKFVFLCERFFGENDMKNLQKLLLYKNVVAFEKEYEKNIFGEERYVPENIAKCANLCDGSFVSTMKIFGMCASEFNLLTPYDVVGSEYYVMALNSLFNVVENLISVQNVLTKLFECQMKFAIIKKDIDVNLHLKYLKKYGIGVLDVNDTILPIFDDAKFEEIKYRTNAYLPYLKNLLDKATNYYAVCKTNFDQKEMEERLALCSGLFERKSIVRFMRDYGYFENLLKN